MRVLIADDEALIRDGVARLLADQGFEIAGKAADAEQLLRRAAALRPDVALIDIRMPPNRTDDGLVAAQQIRAQLPGTAVLVLSQHLDSSYAMRLIEHHPLFPESVNVGFAQVLSPDRIRLRVWERGAGLTLACGTGACAALVACARRGLSDRKATMVLDGGELIIEWRESDSHVIMTGAVAVEFSGTLP